MFFDISSNINRTTFSSIVKEGAPLMFQEKIEKFWINIKRKWDYKLILTYPLMIPRESFTWKSNKSIASFQKSRRAGSFNRWIQIKYSGGTKRKSARLRNSNIIHIGQNIYLHILQLDFPLKNSIFVEPTKSYRLLKLLFKIIIIKIVIKIIIILNYYN